MKQLAYAVERLGIHCEECRRISRRILRGDPLVYPEKAHIEQEVRGARDALAGRIRDGIEAYYGRHGTKWGKGKKT